MVHTLPTITDVSLLQEVRLLKKCISTIRWCTGWHPAFRQQSREDIHIYLYLLYFFKHIHLKRLGLINIFRCPVTMAIGSADIILNLIFQLPQCASPVSRIIESLLPLSLSLPPRILLSLPVAPSHDPTGIQVFFFLISFCICT